MGKPKAELTMALEDNSVHAILGEKASTEVLNLVQAGYTVECTVSEIATSVGEQFVEAIIYDEQAIDGPPSKRQEPETKCIKAYATGRRKGTPLMGITRINYAMFKEVFVFENLISISELDAFFNQKANLTAQLMQVALRENTRINLPGFIKRITSYLENRR